MIQYPLYEFNSFAVCVCAHVTVVVDSGELWV